MCVCIGCNKIRSHFMIALITTNSYFTANFIGTSTIFSTIKN